MTGPLGYLRNGEHVYSRATVNVTAQAFTRALHRVGLTANGAARDLARFTRAVKRAERTARRAERRANRPRPVEGAAYGNPVLLHNGRKPTARKAHR